MVSLGSGTTLGHLISAIGGGLKSLGYDNYSVVVLDVHNFFAYAARFSKSASLKDNPYIVRPCS